MNKCKQCYSCVRNCPVNAVQINNGQASIIHSRCINCGKCVKSCPQNAKIIIDYKAHTLDMLENYQNVIVCLAPSFVASFYPYPYKKIVGGLKKLGFSQVWEVAVGAEILSIQIDEFIENNQEKTYLSTTCPAFVSMIEKHHPELIQHLLPFMSPMVATGKIIREKYKGEEVKVVFIGPCVAKKSEAFEPQLKGIIDSVLTFKELKEIFRVKEIDLSKVEEAEIDGTASQKARQFPLATGLKSNLNVLQGFNNLQFDSIHNDRECLEMINAIMDNKLQMQLIDVLMCKGCIEGPRMDSDLNYYEKINVINEFCQEKTNKPVEVNTEVNLFRSFKNRRSILPLPSKEEIQRILNQTNKYSKEDELNCGACGYSTCENKAVAVLQGIAEVDMCLPYLLGKKEKLYNTLAEKFKEITTLKDELETIIESSYDGIVVTDGEGRILKSNEAWNKMVGYKDSESDEALHEMEHKGVILPSATLLALKEKRRISFIQNALDNKKYFATGTPILDEEGNIKRVVTNIRDIEELNKLKTQIEETMRLEKYHQQDSNRIKNCEFQSENIVANSIEMGEVLATASSVAPVSSTVLILGESGVGKEVVAKLIHKLSKRNNKALISINCGAIPENLIESELFGYETGAFTGAQRKGKPGLIELAHEGTLFLDEVGELSLNLQVKLLRVIQEKKLMRLGGLSETEVDVRIIAATNKNLYQMVLEGKFRSDLYYRLNVVPIEIPPLRKRKLDIIPFCYYFLEKYNRKYGCNKEFSTNVEDIFKKYSWPGNVRELENVIERLVVTTQADQIDEKSLPLFFLEDHLNVHEKVKLEGIIPLKEAFEVVEKKLIERAYQKYKNTYEMAEALGVNQSTVVRKIHKYIKSNALKHD